MEKLINKKFMEENFKLKFNIILNKLLKNIG